MRYKPNSQVSDSAHSHWSHNDIYRRFRAEFDFLLQEGMPCLKSEIPWSCYVKDEDIEERLSYISNSYTNSIQFLIGRTGIGKSTIIQHHFKVYRSPTICGDTTIIIPFSFNGMSLSDSDKETKLAATVNSASRELYKNYRVVMDDKDFISFTDSQTSDVTMRGTSDVTKSDAELRSSLEEADPYAYAIQQFKYYLSQTTLNRVIILVDDIESEPHSIQENIVELMCRLYRCLVNFDSDSPLINLLFSVRPATEKLIRRNKQMHAYSFAPAILIKQPIALNKLFALRMDFAIRKVGTDHIKDINSWREALKILLMIVEQISDKFGYGMLKLFNNNMRRTLAEFKLLIMNRTWLQRGEVPQASFILALENFDITKASVYRALGMRNGKVFPSDEGVCIKNIFENQSEASYDLLMIYVILYLLEKNGSHDNIDKLVEEMELIEVFKKLFVLDNFDSVIDRIIEKMDTCKLLRIETRVKNDGVCQNFIVLQPRAVELWDTLANTTVTLEMFRDDTYQDFSRREKEISTTLNRDALFNESVNFLDQIINWEEKYLKGFKCNFLVVSKAAFGGILISKQVLSGIRNDIHAYYKESPPPQLIKKLKVTSQKVTLLNY